MITFFRKIRKGILGTDQAQRYLLYAIGEIALVVIGILIALQINNWNEQRKMEARGKVYIQEIYADLKSEVYNLNTIISALSAQYKSSEYVLSNFEMGLKGVIDTSELRRNNGNVTRILIVQRDQNTFDELSSSGQTRLLKNDTLANMLERFYENFDIRISNFKEYPLQIRMEIRRLTFPMGNLEDAKQNLYNARYTKAYLKEFFSNKEVYRTILAIFKTCHYNLEFFNNSVAEAEDLVAFMEENYPELKDYLNTIAH